MQNSTHHTSDEDSNWAIFSLLVLVFVLPYFLISVMAWPRTRLYFPLWLLVLSLLFPPFFLLLCLYVVLSYPPPPVTIEAPPPPRRIVVVRRF